MRLPPYGKMSEEYQAILTRPPMSDWMPEADPQERIRSFDTWLTQIGDIFADVIWPRWDPSTGTWIGAAAAWAEEATRAEIEIMIERLQGSSPIINQKASSPAMVAPAKPHLDHYRIEDDLKIQLGVNYLDYDSALTPERYGAALFTMSEAYTTKISGLFRLKSQFLRPRPYQSSMILGHQNFQSRTCRSGVHPAFTSGHCVEGILFSCAILERWLDENDMPNETSIGSLAQYAVDFGDRRVFAGVHYPSDNLASWIIALDLIPRIFRNPERIYTFARDAIIDRSRIFGVIQETFPSNSELSKSLDLLNKLAKFEIKV